MIEVEEGAFQALAAQMRELRDLVAQQQERLAEQEQRLAVYAAEARDLRTKGRDKETDSRPRAKAKRLPRATGNKGNEEASGLSNRRSLLKGAGAAAAAAAVSFAASEQTVAHAQGQRAMNDGANLQAGATTTAESPTVLSYDGTSGNADVIFLVNDSTLTPSSTVATSSQAVLAAFVGNGSTTGGLSGNLNAIYGYTEATSGTGDSEIDGTGVAGYSNTNFGVGVHGRGNFDNGAGVGGSGGIGVYGISGASAGAMGVYGIVHGSSSGIAMMGQAAGGGYGVVAQSDTGIDLAVGAGGPFPGQGRMWQLLQPSTGAPTMGTYNAGEQLRDANGDLYICVFGGSPGVWKKVAAIPAGASGGASVFFSQPYRIFDTRNLSGVPFNNGAGNFPMAPGEIITLQITGTVDPANSSIVVPSGATGIIGDLIGITPSGSGFLGIQPHTGNHNPYAWVNYTSGVTIHNSVVVGLSSDGKVDIECSVVSSGAALTLTGYII